MSSKPTVIVTDTHTRMALAVIRELGQAGFNVVSVTRQGYPSLGHASRYARTIITIPNEGYADALLGLAAKSRPVLLPAGMHTLNSVAERREDFTSAFQMLLPDIGALNSASDKPTVAETARCLELLVPVEYPLNNPSFPCVIKYRNGEALQLKAEARYAIIQNSSQYSTTLSRMQNTGEVFVSQYITGKARGVSVVLDEHSDPLTVFCHERIREYPLTGGPACFAESIWDESLVQSALTLLKALHLQGFAMVEFKGEHILEVNPRIWGTYPLSRLCGAGMSVAYVRGACGEEVKMKSYPIGVRMQYLANDLAHFMASLRKGRFKGRVLVDCINPRVKGGVLDVKDLPGSWAYTVRCLSR